MEKADFEPLFSALHISFSTSIAGLEVSVIVGFLIMFIRRRQEAYFQSMESSTVTMISLARNSINKDEFLAEFSQISNTITQLKDRIYDQTREIHEQTAEIQEGMKKLAEARSDLDEFLKHMSQEQARFLEEVKSLYEALSPKQIVVDLTNGLSKVLEELASTFNTHVTESFGKLRDLNTSLSLLNDSLTKVGSQMAEQAKSIQSRDEEFHKAKLDFYKSLERMNHSQIQFAKETAASMTSLGKGLQNSILETGRNISVNLKSDLQLISKEVNQLNQRLEKANMLIGEQLQREPFHTGLSKGSHNSRLEKWFRRKVRRIIG